MKPVCLALLLCLTLCQISLLSQSCSIWSTTGCPCAVGETPCIQTYLGYEATSMTSIRSYAAPMKQPHITFGAQIMPGDTQYHKLDFANFNTPNCAVPGPNTCTYLNADVINAWIDAQQTYGGMNVQDENNDPSFACAMAEYATYAGHSCTAAGHQLQYLQAGLAVWDAVFDHIKTTGVKLRLAPSPGNTSGILWGSICGISTGMTEGQMEACLLPLYKTWVAHYLAREGAELIAHFTPIHEPSTFGVWPILTGTTLSAGETVTFAENSYAALHSVDPNLVIGVGLLRTDGTYLSALKGLSPGTYPLLSIDFDVYPGSSAVSSGSDYYNVITNAVSLVKGVRAAGFHSAINESSPPRDNDPSQSGGETGTYYGCGYYLATSSGLTGEWAREFYNAMAAAGAEHVSMFSSMALFATTTNGMTQPGTGGQTGWSCNPGPFSTWILQQPDYPSPTSNMAVVKRLNAGFLDSLQGKISITGTVGIGQRH
jgi:hypothetical protein